MRAAVLFGPGDMRVLDNVKEPECNNAGIVVRIMASAICGTDIKIIKYGHPRVRYPWVIGHENAGIIEAVGSEVDGFKVGDRVAIGCVIPCRSCYYCFKGWPTVCANQKAIGYEYFGGFAELMSIPPEGIAAGIVGYLPQNLSFAEATLAEPLSCVINGQEFLGITLNDIVAVIGAGPIGCMHVALARARGVKSVIAIEVSEQRLEIAKRFGADLRINPQHTNMHEMVKEYTEGQGADVVIVACPSAEAQQHALEIVRSRGRVSFFAGLPRGISSATINSNIIHYKEVSVYGGFASGPLQYREALELIALKKIKLGDLISHTFSLHNIAEATKVAESGEGLKVVIQPNG